MNGLDYKKYFEGKRITKQGFGFLGRGANVVKFLLENGASVLVTDMKSEKDLEQSIKEVEDFIKENNIDKNKIICRLGEHKPEDFGRLENKDGKIIGCDYVIQASGVPKDNMYLKHSKDQGIKVYQESSLFVEIIRNYNNNLEKENKSKEDIEQNKIKIIGITGTRGKTTTTFLIKKMIEDFLNKENGESKDGGGEAAAKEERVRRKVYFGGNVQGVATLENLKYIKEGDVIVMELDSWILQGFKDINYSPDLAVFTNIMADHMNYYKNDMREYFLDKANIFLYQKGDNVFITTEDLEKEIEKYLSPEDFQKYSNSKNIKNILSENKIQEINNNFRSNLLGYHNKINVALAITVAQKFGVDDESIQKSLDSFTGVAGRMEKIKTLNGVDYINDTCATTPDAAIAALTALMPTLKNNSQIILITGGKSKELDVTNYVNNIIQLKVKNVIKKILLLSDSATTGTDILVQALNDKKFFDYELALNLEIAVNAARSAAEESAENKFNSKDSTKNNIILFTPAFASFGMFQNEYDRGEKFNQVVNNLK